MKMSRLAYLVAAVSTVSLGANLHAADLRWDFDGAGGAFGADGTGNWDLSTPNWNDTPATNVNWIQGSNAIFGDPANTTPIVGNAVPFNVSVLDDLVVTDLHINTASNGGAYNFDAPNFNSLTINGNVYKNTNTGQVKFDLLAGPFILGAGDHVFALNDTGGNVPEMQINANISGSGGITVDNRLTLVGAKEAWGTLSTTGINTYDGLTNLKFGRLVISQGSGLGSTVGGTVISEAGTLSVGGPGVTPPSSVTISEPITITRNTYAGGEFARYGAAIITENGSGTTTFNGPIVVDSNDARIAAFTSTALITSNIVAGPNATAPSLSVTGDFAGFVHLTGNNTALTGGVSIISAVQLDVDNDNQIGGPSAPLNFIAGGTYHPVNGYATSFGSHVLNNATFNGGLNIDAGQTFTIDQPLGRAMGSDVDRVGSLGKRGTGTLNINSSINLRGGQTYWDAGTVNVNTPIELANLHLRSPIVNIPTGASITTITGYSSFGEASTGTNGGPDIAVMNITGGKFQQNQNEDLNISDLANTRGTINLSAGELITSGLVHLGRNNNAIGTINQTGGALKVNRTGNFAFIVSRGQGQGVYNLSGGTFDALGEVYVGQGGGNETSGGQWNQSGGTATISNWFVIGRESGKGDVDISGGTLVKNGGGNVPIGEGTNARGNSFKVRGTGTFNAQTGEVWVSNGNTETIFTLADSGTVNVNNWFAIGRGGAARGTVNMSGGTFTKAGANWIGVGSGGQGTFNQTGGNLVSNGTLIGEASNGTMNLSGGTSTFTGDFRVGQNGGVFGTLNISGTANVTAPAVVMGNNAGTGGGTIALSGGSLTATSIAPGAGTGAKTVNFTGGRLSVGTYSLPTVLANSGTGILAPGGVGAIGSTAITAGYDQSSTAKMAIELASGGTDTVSSPAAVNLGGALQLSLLAGYDPAFYAPMTFITGGSVVSHFQTVEGVNLSQNKALAVTYTPTTAVVTAAIPGDLTVDGAVNFDDLVPLAQNYSISNATWSTGDFNGDSFVNFDDLVILAQHYGNQATFEADWAYAMSIAPEPVSLMALGFTGLLGMRRRSK